MPQCWNILRRSIRPADIKRRIFHTSWWDYSDQKFNFQGRICLGVSLGWGVLTVLLFRVIHPLVEKLVAIYPVYVGKIAVCVIAAGYLCDFCRSASAAFHLKERIPYWEQDLEKKRVELMLRLNVKLESLELPKGASPELLREKLEDSEALRILSEKRLAFQKEFTEELRAYRKTLVNRTKGNTRRFLKAYPHLNRGYRMRHKKDKK